MKINIEGWKGKDQIEISKIEGGFQLVEHRKDKDTGKIEEIKHFVPLNNVINLANVIDQIPLYTDIGYRELVKILIKYYSFQVTEDAFNGGRNRARYYFPYYYFPVKILENKGKIKYYGRGNIQRLR